LQHAIDEATRDPLAWDIGIAKTPIASMLNAKREAAVARLKAKAAQNK
jgi:hypothetical protein